MGFGHFEGGFFYPEFGLQNTIAAADFGFHVECFENAVFLHAQADLQAGRELPDCIDEVSVNFYSELDRESYPAVIRSCFFKAARYRIHSAKL